MKNTHAKELTVKKTNFGVGIPTGTEGLMYPIPFAKVRDNIKISMAAETLGYDSVWGNDHVSTQHYVRDEFDAPPNYYAPLMTLAAIAENTERIKVATALLVVPFREPAIIAKEVATLDQLSNGRAIIGLGIGAYREEFVAMRGDYAKKVHRGELLDECIAVLEKIFREDVVTFKGKYFELHELQSYPKPIQRPFPFYIGGNAPQGRERTARYGQGWLPAVLSPAEIKSGVEEIKSYCDKYGRNFDEIDIAPQLSVSIGKSNDDAVEKLKKSQLYKHMVSLKKSTLKDQDTSRIDERNLIGTPDKIGEQIERYIDAGVTTFSAMLFAVNTVDEFIESMQFFAEEVMTKFR